MMMNADRAFDWNDTIEHDSEFVLFPEGDYDFEVVSFERARHPGSEKLPPCNKAVLSLRFTSPDLGTTTIKHNLFLHSKTEGMLCAFFTAIGQRKHGEKLAMNWNTVVGSRGRAKLGVRSWKNNDGEDRQSNEIKRFYEPDETTSSAKPAGFQPGRF